MSIYQPSDDSYLLSEVLKEELPNLVEENPNLKVLEVGIGSGFQLETLFSLGIKKENLFGCDINPKAVEHCKKLGFQCIKSNLFENVEGNYDIIIFNPPYLPLDKREPKDSKTATTGGKKGNEIIVRFLGEAKKHLNEDGKIYIVTSSFTDSIDFENLGYNSKKVNSEKLFFEEVFVWKLALDKPQ